MKRFTKFQHYGIPDDDFMLEVDDAAQQLFGTKVYRQLASNPQRDVRLGWKATVKVVLGGREWTFTQETQTDDNE